MFHNYCVHLKLIILYYDYDLALSYMFTAVFLFSSLATQRYTAEMSMKTFLKMEVILDAKNLWLCTVNEVQLLMSRTVLMGYYIIIKVYY